MNVEWNDRRVATRHHQTERIGLQDVQNRCSPRDRILGITREVVFSGNVLRFQGGRMPVEGSRMDLFAGATKRADHGEKYSHVVAEYEHPLRTPVTHRVPLFQGIRASVSEQGCIHLFRTVPVSARTY